MLLTAEDHARVAAAVAAAERGTAGEIATIVAARSDKYHDVALHWAVLAMLAVPAALSAWPGAAERVYGLVSGPWGEAPGASALFAVALVLMTVAFLLVRALLAWMPLRLALVPGVTEARRVRARALDHFAVGTEHRTRAATGVLLYLSVAERRAEIVADAGIHAAVGEEAWGDIMADLLAAVKDGRAGDGLVGAVGAIGALLVEHFPKEDGVNELPDRVVEL